jgi:hypothetical protein
MTEKVYIRNLVFQPTGHVVWAAIETNPNQVNLKRVPTVCPELDYRTYLGPMPTEKQYWADLIGYRLIKPDWVMTKFETGALPPEFKDKVKLMRAQCYAVNSIHSSVRFYNERNGTHENPMMTEDLDISILSAIYSKQFNIPIDQAQKLVEFKRNELLSVEKNLNYVQIEAELAIANASTADEVVTIYRITQNSLGMTNAFDIAKML